MFTELGVMVEFQEQPIENISQQVSRATKLARAARRKKWWCLGVCFLIIVVIVVVVVVTQVVNKKPTGTT